ncbi:MAG: helix-turn-helix transcriptional regulator [Actinomycetota bacterium]|nr:helix-turn-helix transcriptional regulator [Actinomycetota bacterium]
MEGKKKESGTRRRQGLPLPGLREARARRGYTLAELAEKSEVARSAIAAIEQGHRNARPSTMRKLARTLDVSVEHLAGVDAEGRAQARASETMALVVGMYAEEKGITEEEAERQIRERREELERRALGGGRRRLGLPRDARVVLRGGGENAASGAVSAVRGA